VNSFSYRHVVRNIGKKSYNVSAEKKDMDTIHLIRAHINRLREDVIFTTRDFLCYGTRSAVDAALHRLIKKDMIIRVARGVFIKWTTTALRGDLPTAQEVAQTKARAFGKEIFVHKKDAAAQLGLIESGNDSPTFAAFGRTTSFQFGDQRIKLAHISPKDAKHGDTFTGLFIRALRQLGWHDQAPTTIGKLISGINSKERDKTYQAAAMMPSWIADQFKSDDISTRLAVLRIKSLTAT
jgi:hypothetical protein